MSDWPNKEQLSEEGNSAWHAARESARRQSKGRARAESFWLNQRRSKLIKKGNRISDPDVRIRFISEHPEVREWYDIDEERFMPNQRLQ